MKEREELIDEMQSIFPRIPLNVREVLNMLTDPKVIEHTKRFIEAMDVNSKCLNYQAPWSCILEAEARYQNIKYGWLGGGGTAYSEWWCDNCRKKVMSGSTFEHELEEEETETAVSLDILKDTDPWPNRPA